MINILIADDHGDIRRRVTELLLDDIDNIRVEEVDDSPALIEKARSGNWDIIISDVAMPGGSGLDAVKQICLHTPSQRILMLSINDEEKYSGYARSAGAAGYVNKINVAEELVPAVRAILDGKQYFRSL